MAPVVHMMEPKNTIGDPWKQGPVPTPVCDFVRAYAHSSMLRLHMPGHKGVPRLGPEPLDITEIAGADELYHARGILRQSEQIAASLFGSARTVYSAGGSSQCVRAMAALALDYAREAGLPARILAGRNAHQSFVTAAALLDLDVDWLFPAQGEGILSCTVTPDALDRALSGGPYAAVYLTSPDYLGRMADIRSLAAVCHAHGVLLLVDNAHGAYLRFLPEDQHPLSLGADLCCDSAHKTLPCLTGAAYLHISRSAPPALADRAEQAMKLFGSTSPSWLILQSLDRVNTELAGDFPRHLADACCRVAGLRATLEAIGWHLEGQEPMKLTLVPKSFGYTGTQLADRLRRLGAEPEFADPDFITLMPSPDTPAPAWFRLSRMLGSVPRRDPLPSAAPLLPRPVRFCSIRQAMLAPREEVPTSQASGRVLAEAALSCPPAVYIAVPGEILSPEAVDCFRYYGIDSCWVQK